jgi:hypothetical protein
MSNIQDSGDPGTEQASLPAAADVSTPWAIQRIRRQLYWQAVFALIRASFGLLVILLVVQNPASLGAIVSAGVFVAGGVLAVASVLLARQVTSRRRTTRLVIVGLEAAVGVVYGLLTVQAVVGVVAGGGLAAVAFNGIGLLIAGSVLRHTIGNEARAWFDAP